MQYKRLVLSLDTASAFLFLYDVLLSFNLELEYMWKSEWKIFKILYIIQRYLPVADTVIALPYRNFAADFTPEVRISNAHWYYYASVSKPSGEVARW
uniref:DUF6533 domain-containing protein n=1 Tax=Moniliophthora roreri TaxID=221103 RepID=A0A0W0F554_MONRR